MKDILARLQKIAFDMTPEQAYWASVTDADDGADISDIRSICRIINEKVEKHCKHLDAENEKPNTHVSYSGYQDPHMGSLSIVLITK